MTLARARVGQEALDETIRRTQDYFLRTQHRGGYWVGELETNVCMAAEYLLLTHFLGARDSERWRKLVNYIRSQQRDDGTWTIYEGGPPDINATVEAYFALKLAGVAVDEPRMMKARDWVLSAGGVPKARVFTKIWLALFGQWDWRGVPTLPPELMFLPHWVPLNIYDFASWARATIVPMLIILSQRPVCAVPERARIDELYPDGREGTDYSLPEPNGSLAATFFHRADVLLRRYDRMAVAPVREAAYCAAEEWIVAHQEADGSWGGIQPPWVYSLIALKLRGYSLDHPVMKQGLDGFERDWAIEDGETFNPQACLSPVWDTALAMNALLDSGLDTGHPELVQAGNWLLGEQVLTGGDWQLRAKGVEPGGWSFEFENDMYPDADDTAEVLIALQRVRLPNEHRKRKAVELGRRWLIGMQSSDGGWGAFDRNNTRQIVNEIPFCDFGEVIDPPSEDVTAHVIEALCAVGDGDSAAVRRGLRYLRRKHKSAGSWFGRWGVNHVYGTGGVLPAFRAAGCDMSKRRFLRAAKWLAGQQNEDRGWGEDPRSYDDPAWVGRGASTPSQTAWGVLGLLSVNGDELHSRAVEDGISWLVERQEEDGQWLEPQFTGTGFPGDFYIKYHLYRNYWPLMALGRYRAALT
ncbi:MAG TPA: squalene--hopene cyclase [Dehalococcoidia bacterium]|nr:squalene--hopene cyclase [Dehalococcoidia bacterium]